MSEGLRSTALRYALALLCIALVVALQIALIGPVPASSQAAPLIHPTGLFQAGVVAAAWFGGVGPGLLAALLATLVMPRLIAMNYPLLAGFFDLPRFLAFTFTALAVGWGITRWRRAEAALRGRELELRQARAELESKVLEQTAELRRSEAVLARAQQLSQTGSFSWKPLTRELLWSEEMFRIYGYGRTPPPTFELGVQRLHPEDRLRVLDAFDRAARDGHDFELEHRLLMPDGSVRFVRSATRAVRDESGSIEFVGAVMDVTERTHAEEALQKAQGELAHVTRVMTMGELAASIAHEVNQPLTAVIANANASLRWLAAANPNLDEARDAVSRIVRDGNRAGEVIARIRALVQKTDTEKVRLDINQAVQEVVILMQIEAVRKGVAIRMDLAADVPPLFGDRIQLQQVILN